MSSILMVGSILRRQGARSAAFTPRLHSAHTVPTKSLRARAQTLALAEGSSQSTRPLALEWRRGSRVTNAMGERIQLSLVCEACGARNYRTTRARHDTDPVRLKKFCKHCSKHTEHVEAR